MHLNSELDFSHDMFQRLGTLRAVFARLDKQHFLDFFACLQNHYLHHSETLNQLLPLLRKLFHLSGCTKYWRRSQPISCCNAAAFTESQESLRVTLEALSLGICWEQTYQCFCKDRDQLCQEDEFCFLAHTQICPNTPLA